MWTKLQSVEPALAFNVHGMAFFFFQLSSSLFTFLFTV